MSTMIAEKVEDAGSARFGTYPQYSCRLKDGDINPTAWRCGFNEVNPSTRRSDDGAPDEVRRQRDGDRHLFCRPKLMASRSS